MQTILNKATKQMTDGSYKSNPYVPFPCQMFPRNNIWNTRIDRLPVSGCSTTWINEVGSGSHIHPYFGPGTYSGGPIGIPFVVVPQDQPLAQIVWVRYPPAPADTLRQYPIPIDPPVEWLSDKHVLIVQKGTHRLYELWQPEFDGNNVFSGSVGSIAWWDMDSNTQRTLGWTTADAAGLAMACGLVNYEEIVRGHINHALRLNLPYAFVDYLWPATHVGAGSTNSRYPPYGARFRLKSSTNISGAHPQVQVILRCLMEYGMIVADQGAGFWQLNGPPDERYNNIGLDLTTLVNELHAFHGSDLEAVDESSLMVSVSSMEAKQGIG